MPRRDPNRITVDLKLLQDKNLDRLEQIMKDFRLGAETLAQHVGSYSQQVAGAANQTPAGQPGPNASVSGPGGAGHGGGGPSNPTQPLNVGKEQNRLSRYGFGDANINEYERAQFSLGNLGQGGPVQHLQYLSHMFQKAGFKDEIQPDGSTKLVPSSGWHGLGTLSRNVGGGLGAIARGSYYAQSLGSVYKGVKGGVLSNASFSANVGDDGGMSGQAWGGFKSSFQSKWRGKFGMGRYSPEQAEAARQAVNAYGYGGDEANGLLDTLQQMETSGSIRGLISSEDMMKLIDPAKRFGTDDVQSMVDAIYDMPDAARAARMSLKQFTEEVINTAQQLAAGGNMTIGGSVRALTAFTAATGMSPEKATGMLNDPNNMYLNMGMSGKSAYQLTYGRHAMTDRMKAPVQIAEQILGMPLEQLHALKKSNPKAYDDALSRLIMMQQQNPELLGGMTVDEIVNLGNRKNAMGRMNVMETLQTADQYNTNVDFNALQDKAQLGQGLRDQFWDRTREWQAKGVGGKELRSKQADLMSKQLADSMRGASKNATSKTTFDLSPDARRLLRIMDNEKKSESNARGKANRYAHKAVEWGANAVEFAWENR